MRNLLLKEFKLAMHPTNIIFLTFSMMLIIPNYPYYVTFFYTGLAVFFTCLSGRENQDIFYTMLLPVRKKDIVKARFIFVIIMQLLQILVAVPFAILRQSMKLPGNQVGMDANLAFFGFTFVMLGIFNLVFFGIYYKNVNKVGKAFGVASTIVFVYIIIAEACAHAIPYVRDTLDTIDTVHVVDKIIVLVVGIVIYVLVTYLSYIKSAKNFESLDL